MHGDFSRWFPKIPKNQVGILAQEGRVLLDADVNAGTLLGMRWQDLAARAAFGAGVAAIPADALDGWNVVRAELSGQQVKLELIPGIAWADGLLVELDGPPRAPVQLTATPLGPPIQTPPTDVGASGTRDAVILETWRRARNGYQVPTELLEPALGGPDTAERIETAYALRLLRLGQGESCRSIIGKLRDDLSKRATLHATLAPTTTTTGDCPVVLGGGYSGFEHDTYRVEIADVDSGAPSFKWSQWNGGLCGRAVYDASTKKLRLVAGDQAILRSGLTTFYVEVLVHDADLGHWRVAYGARASLDTTDEIDLSGPPSFGALPAATGSWFIRVWNELRAVTDFPAGSPTELRDGIRLEFAGSELVPGDYWTFSVRAGGLDNPSPLLDHAPPHGVHHHRVPLAELHWTSGTLTPNHGIEDCRVPLHPVTASDGCCTYSVGDGIISHGDFTKIQDAINALPGTGGRVCVLPGEYVENVVIKYRNNVEVIGCGPRSKIVAPPAPGEFNPALPAIHVLDTSGIRIEGVQVIAGWGGIAILLEADDGAGTVEPDGTFFVPNLERARVIDCLVQASTGSGIEVRRGHDVELCSNHVIVRNEANSWAAITLATTDACVQRNRIEVQLDKEGADYVALGGVWLRGGCERIDIVDNTIIGGSGHGIMLGHVEEADVRPNVAPALHIRRGFHGFVFHPLFDPDCVGCGPGDVVVDPPGGDGPTWVSGDPLVDITIRGNRIERMGMCGIGVFGYFRDQGQGIITIENIEIANNRIARNLTRPLRDLPGNLASLIGYGAISLSDVIDLVVRDNEITNNAPNTTACAIFVLSGEGVEVSGNRILGNGPIEPQHAAQLFPHGGIWLQSVTPPSRETEYAHIPRGRLAAAIVDNEVHAPNGPALVMRTLGHVQVTGNSLVTESIQGINGVATVMIASYSLGLNIRPDATFGGIKTGVVKAALAPARLTIANRVVENRELLAEEIAGARLTIRPIRDLLAAFRPPPGSVLFANNHVILRPARAGSFSSSVSLSGLVDMEVANNHFEAAATQLFQPVRITGSTVRVSDNRFVERTPTVWSAFAHGVYTNVTGNTADHCLLATATTRLVKASNIEINGAFCRWFPTFPGSFGLTTVTEVHP